jgi:hypothetical protein
LFGLENVFDGKVIIFLEEALHVFLYIQYRFKVLTPQLAELKARSAAWGTAL